MMGARLISGGPGLSPDNRVDEGEGDNGSVVSLGDAEWAVSTVLNVVLVILGITELRERARVRRAAQHEAQSDFEARRAGRTFDPYREYSADPPNTDFKGNTAKSIRDRLWAMTIGTYLLLGGLVSFATLYLVQSYSVGQSSDAFQSAIGDLGLIVSLIGLVGLVLLWWGLHEMTSPNRRYILATIAVWMGMKVPKEQRPIEGGTDKPKPVDDSLVKLQRKMKRKGTRGKK